LLGEECLDWDLVTFCDAHKTARQLANTLGGHYVHMHAKASRVIVFVEDPDSSHSRKEICFDISPQIGKTIEDDLRQRDFTINAIAAPLDEVVRYLESDITQRPTQNVGAPLAGALGDGMGILTDGVRTMADGVGTLADGTDFLGSWLIDPLHGLSDLQ